MTTDITKKYVNNLNLIKVVGLFFCLAFLVFLPLKSASAFGAFGDPERSEGNLFSASSLNIDLTEDSYESFINYAGTTTATTTVSDEGDLEAQYHIESVFEVARCVDEFRDHLSLTAFYEGGEEYSGPLADFTSATSTDFGEWSFEFVLDPSVNIAHDTECDFDLVFKASPDGATSPAGTFYDEDIFNIVLTANGVVLNEVLANPEDSDTQLGLDGEWVEVYNNSTSTIYLDGWYILDDTNTRKDFATSTTLSGQNFVGPRGSSNEWEVLFMNGQVLRNTGDTVSLYDADDNLRDRYSYSGGSSGDEGKSDARIPDGYGPWIDPIPTPGAPNILDDEEIIEIPEVPEIVPEIVVVPEDGGGGGTGTSTNNGTGTTTDDGTATTTDPGDTEGGGDDGDNGEGSGGEGDEEGDGEGELEGDGSDDEDDEENSDEEGGEGGEGDDNTPDLEEPEDDQVENPDEEIGVGGVGEQEDDLTEDEEAEEEDNDEENSAEPDKISENQAENDEPVSDNGGSESESNQLAT